MSGILSTEIEPSRGSSPSGDSRRLMDTATRVALAPVVAYALAFSYESGYVGWFGVPFWVIRVDLMHVLFASGAVGLLFVLVGSLVAGAPASLLRLGPVVLALALPVLLGTGAVYVAATTQWTLSWTHAGFAVFELLTLLVCIYGICDVLILSVHRFRNVPNSRLAAMSISTQSRPSPYRRTAAHFGGWTDSMKCRVRDAMRPPRIFRTISPMMKLVTPNAGIIPNLFELTRSALERML